jgi:lysophospholipase L1-like esterase
VAFGDSMTEGVAAPPLPSFHWTLPGDAGLSTSYPYKLKALLEARYTGQTISVVNAGWSGRQAREDAERLSDVLQQAKPDLLLLFEGVNDLSAPLVGTEGPSTRIRAVVDALEEMVRESSERRQIPVLIATLPPQRAGGRRAWSIDLLPEFNESLRTTAGKRNAAVVELDQLPLSFIGDDGLHPTESGYQRMAEVWLDAIKARYERAPAAVAR